MKSIRDYFKSASRVGAGVALAAAMALGGGLSTADAQVRNYGHDYIIQDRNMRQVDIRQLALVNGYSEGYEMGLRNRRSRGADFRSDPAYRSATSGYDQRWGRMNDYRAYFRQGYVQGYNDAIGNRARNRNFDRGRLGNTRVYDYRNSPYDPYYNYPSYGNYGSYGNPYGYANRRGDLNQQEVAERAAQNGYYAGFQRGQYDAQQRARANPQGHGAYQFGFDGFDPEWGSAATYQQYYRQYFIQGYNDAFGRRTFNQRYYRRF
jgi:hypothetical protein